MEPLKQTALQEQVAGPEQDADGWSWWPVEQVGGSVPRQKRASELPERRSLGP